MEQPIHHKDEHDQEGKDQVEEVSSPISMPQRPHHEDEHDQEGKDQVEEVSSPISMPQGPITRSKSKKLQQALIHYLQGLVSLASEGLQGHQNFGINADQVQYNLI